MKNWMSVGRDERITGCNTSIQLLHVLAANKASLHQSFTRTHNFPLAMASLLSAVPGASSHVNRATLGLVSQRIVSSNISAVASVASIGRRLHQGAACLASSSSCQSLGSSELVSWKSSAFTSRKQARQVHTPRIRCEQTTEGGNRRSFSTWIGRLAMLGFAAVIFVEVSTGKGILATAGLPLLVPTPLLGVIALGGAVTAFGVFRSSDRD